MIPNTVSLEALNQPGEHMGTHLGIEFTELGDNYLCARMPVDHRTKQPMGLLHGGASVVLAETLGSVGGNLLVAHENKYCVGVEVNANHLKSVKEGFVMGRAEAVHIGRKIQVWEIKITNEQGQLTCISRLTLAVMNR
ncbi:hotdog fold thioesterase [Rapidithrix thailandica]|uniref:Hotdog fold thioesterase n=1 Tax=Rapidithrix thailandica TaxID=413964 RepID=A0AAW9SGC2_9BACT